MALLKKLILKTIVPCCLRPSVQNQCPIPRLQDCKQLSVRRLALSDLSNPDSRISISDLSSSLMVGTDLHVFTLKELQVITHSFSKANYLGEGGFGPVFKGFVDDKVRPGLKAQPVAVKKLDLNGSQGDREWLAEVVFLGELKHTHLVNLIGYCCEDEHRLLVYEYLERGNLDDQLFGKLTATLPWSTRLKIAVGAAKGLAFLHEEENPVIYRDFKASNVLLDADFNAKVSDFGLATDGPDGDDTHVSTRIMGTKGYAAPEYLMTGHLTTMSDVYSYGVVLLELLTGRRALQKVCLSRKQSLVEWARPMLKDQQKLDQIMDTNLEGQYSSQGAKRAALVAYKCLSSNPKSRPSMSDVVKALEPLIALNYDIPIGPFVYIVPPEAQNVCDQNVVEEVKKETRRRSHRQGGGSRWRHKIKALRDGTVHSDTALYRILGASLYSPMNQVGERTKETRTML